MVFGFSTSSAFLFFYQHQNLEESYRKIDFSANMLAMESRRQKENNEKILVKYIQNHSFSEMESFLKNISGTDDFLKDFEAWKTVFFVETTKTEEGFFLNVFTPIGEGDLIHPFSGFIREKKNKIEEIIWGKPAMGTLLKFESPKQGDFWKATLKNNGPYPWIPSDHWKNGVDGKDMTLIPSHGKKEVPPGETGIFLFQENESFFPENETRAFLFLLKADEKLPSQEFLP